jgi:predicted cation transporter
MMPFICLVRKQSSKQQDGEYTKVYCFCAGAGAALFSFCIGIETIAVCYVSFFFSFLFRCVFL